MAHLVVVDIETTGPSSSKFDEKTGAEKKNAGHVEENGSLGERSRELGLRHGWIGE